MTWFEQCAFVDTPEIETITDFIGTQQAYPSALLLPEYVGENSKSDVNDVDLSKKRQFIRSLGAEGRCVLVCSHILHEVESVAQRIVVMQQGRTLADGSARELRAELAEVPLTVRIETSDPSALALRLVALDGVREVSRTHDVLSAHVPPRDPVRRLGRVGRRRERTAHDVRRTHRRVPRGRLRVPHTMSEPGPPPRAALPREMPTAPRPLAGFGVMARQAFSEGWRRRRLLLVLLAGIGLGVTVGLLMAAEEGNDPGGDAAVELWLGLGRFVVAMLFPLIALLLGSQGFARLRSDRTLVYHLVRPVGRETLFLARWAAGLPTMIAIAVATVGGAVLASGVRVPLAGWLGLIGLSAIAMVVLSAIYFTLAAVARHGLIYGLVYTFVIEGMIATMPGSVQRGSISHHLRGLMLGWCGESFSGLSDGAARTIKGMTSDQAADNAASFFGQTDYLPASTEIVVLLAIAVGVLLWGMRRVRRKDWPLKD